MFNKCIKLISTKDIHNKKIKVCSIMNVEVNIKILGDCTSHSKGYCNCFKKNTSDMYNMQNHELVKYDKQKLKEMIIGSTGASVKMKLKINILHNAINGKTFTVIDETGDLKEMVKHAELKVTMEQLENGNIKYTFNSPKK